MVGVPYLVSAPRQASAITRENVDRIRVGMTEEEVADILGGPPGSYTNRPDPVLYHGVTFRRWRIGDEAMIEVSVGTDPSARVRARGWHKEFWPYPESLAERLIRRSGP